MAILARSLKTRIFWKSAKGRRREIFQKSLKSSLRLKGPKALCCKGHYPRFWRIRRIQKCPNGHVMAIFASSPKLAFSEKVQRLEKILAHKAALKVPQWPSYSNLGKVTQKPHFLKKCKGGTKKNFSKFPKNSPHLKGPRALWAKWHYPLISMQLKCKDWRKLWRKKKLQKCPKGHVMAIFERSPKPAFSKKRWKGGPRKIF